MRRRRLVLAPEQHRLLEAVARQAAPEECCGILLGREPRAGVRVVTRLLPAENARAVGRESAYEIAPAEVIAAWRSARSAGEKILGFYHSHPGGVSRPSARDARSAWSGMSYLIVAPGEQSCELTSWSQADFDTACRSRGERLAGIGGSVLEREELRSGRSREGAA